MYDLVIKDGLIFDGTGAPRVRGDIGIAGGVITAMGRVDAREAERVIDARGMHVAPGFVDLHTHYDAQIFWDPYCTLSGWHGITSVAIGNCGFGFAPVEPDMREVRHALDDPGGGHPLRPMRLGMPWDWVSFPEYLDSVERTPKAVNILPLVPVGPMLVAVLGLQDAKAGRMPTDDERTLLAKLLHEALDAGGCGWTAQRLPPTGPAAVQRMGRHADAHRHDDRRDLPGVRPGARRAQPRRAADDAHHRRREARHGDAGGDRLALGRPMLHNVIQAFADRPHVHRRGIEWLERCRERASPSTARASPATPVSPTPSRTGTSTTTPRPGWRPRWARWRNVSTSWPTPPAARR
ncbi:MAG: amidohydrolase family protein [Acidimicrobiales bacterium]